jgi:hypothetical protein
MPKQGTLKDYSKSMIYKIEPIGEHEEHEIYFGSTTKKYLSQKFSGHRGAYKEWKNGNSRSYVSSCILFDKYGVDQCQILLIEDFPCKNVNEL